MKTVKKSPCKVPDRVYLGSRFPNIYWTRREAECIFYLVKKNKRKSIANILGLSVRTIDAYMETAKAKLNCRSQRELLFYLPETDFFLNVEKLKIPF
ncbi:MAG: hypothetical protein A3F17_08870 [Gammaproteobacteria bacterium RIFCSPHIGHO2_12_FULL_41_15]|nr:MAG: hypothetical protein A3F17_08870 [Gammaproteobacteria bacterium RIFCSPHIGHO2_12_FULL_41_15]